MPSDHDPDDYLNFRMLSDTKLTARRQHTCCTCKKPIKVGDQYRRISYTLDGVFMCNRFHYVCYYAGDYEQ